MLQRCRIVWRRLTQGLASGLLAVPLTLQPGAAPKAPTDATRIVAVVNGEVISNADVESRTRLFALSTGLPMAPDVLDRLKKQIVRQLVDERLRMQEVQRRKIVVGDKDIAAALHEIEAQNRMADGALRQRLTAGGVSPRTLIDQIRTQIGWIQVLRESLGEKAQINDAEVAEQQRILTSQTGQPEFRVGEIFIPVDDPASSADAQRFAETVIKELRAGAPFSMVAAQFSQNPTALMGGELGWVRLNQLDSAVGALVQQMPVGAVSNPVPVPGGFDIVTLQGRRETGRDMGTVLSVRQVFFPFTSPLNPQAPTDQQKQMLEKARSISTSVHSCAQMEQVAANEKSPRPADPGEIRLEGVNPPAFRQQLATLSFDHPTQPLVAGDGIAVLILCSREQRNLASLSAQELRQKLLSDRIELASRQLQRELRRRADIDIRNSNGA